MKDKRTGKVNEAGHKPSYYVKVAEDGSLVIPPEITHFLGADPGSALRFSIEKNRIEVFPNIHTPGKIYIEVTTNCNFACETCVRNTWSESIGDMPFEVFESLIEQLREFPHINSVMFGGFGEPLFHPDIIKMVSLVTSLGLKSEITTNGSLLDNKMIDNLRAAGVDTLWISFDGATTSTFEAIRKGADFKQILDSLRYLNNLNLNSDRKVHIGLTFVAMKKNVNDLVLLPDVINITGADRVSVSNVLPYSRDIVSEELYGLTSLSYSATNPEINLPLWNMNEQTRNAFFSIAQMSANIYLMGNPISVVTRKCRFIAERCTFIRWDGEVAPCMGLLHSYTTYLNDNDRTIRNKSYGNIKDNTLKEIWESDDYAKFRETVDAFDFSYCFSCGGCQNIYDNEKDCFGNEFPTCGGCFWAYGIIQCP